MKEKVRKMQAMIEDAQIIIAGDLFKKIYDLDDLGWVYVVGVIKMWAREFVDELNWQGDDDERDWLIELENFEERKFEELKERCKTKEEPSFIDDDVRLSLELYRNGNGFGIWLSDDAGGSGIKAVGNTPQEAANNIAPYIADYFYENDYD